MFLWQEISPNASRNPFGKFIRAKRGLEKKSSNGSGFGKPESKLPRGREPNIAGTPALPGLDSGAGGSSLG